MKNAFLCLLFSCLVGYLTSIPITGRAQKSYLGINSVHLPKLIADNNILMATQDEAGLLWFVTENGLYRYDGTELLHFGIGTTPALPSLSITALCTDNRGNLWIGFKNGAAKFDLKNWSISELSGPNWSSISPHDKQITAVACLADGDIYFGTQGGKLFTVRSGSLLEVTDLGAGRRKFMPTGPPVQEPAIKDIQEPVTGQLWLTTGDGMLVSINKNKKAYDKPLLYKLAITEGMPLMNICYDSSGQCLFSIANRGTFQSDIKKLYREKTAKKDSSVIHGFSNLTKSVALPGGLQVNNYYYIFYIPGGKVGITILDKGLTRYIYKYDFSTGKWLQNAQTYIAKYPGELIHSISSLASGQVAYINAGGGLTAVHAKSLPFDMKLNSENNINSIRAIYAEGEDLYIGSYQQYFLRFNKATGKITPLKTLFVYTILPWGKDSLLIGSEGGGLLWYNPSSNQLTSIGVKFDLTRRPVSTKAIILPRYSG